jgi:hypothetical protein
MSLVLTAFWKQIFAPLFAVNTLVNCENEIHPNDLFCQDSGMPTSFPSLKLNQNK